MNEWEGRESPPGFREEEGWTKLRAAQDPRGPGSLEEGECETRPGKQEDFGKTVKRQCGKKKKKGGNVGAVLRDLF